MKKKYRMMMLCCLMLIAATAAQAKFDAIDIMAHNPVSGYSYTFYAGQTINLEFICTGGETGFTGTPYFDGTLPAGLSISNNGDDRIYIRGTCMAADTQEGKLCATSKANNGETTRDITITVIGPPTATDLAFTIPTGHIYNGSPQGIGAVTAAQGVNGLGDITAVYYNDIAAAPTNAGSYAVTVDIAQGVNYAAVDGLLLGTYTIAPSSTRYTFTLTASEGIHLNPGAGTYAVETGESFTFYVTLSEGYEGRTPQATVNGDPVQLQLRPNGTEWVYCIPWVYDDTRVAVTFATTANLNPDTFRMYSRDGQLFIETAQPADLAVYSVTGQQLLNRYVTDGLTSIALPGGVYLVRIDGQTAKIVVK